MHQDRASGGSLEIQDVPRGDLQRAAFGLERNQFSAGMYLFPDFIHTRAKLLVDIFLQQIPKNAHAISGRRILDIACNENNNQILRAFPQPPCGLHAVDAGHFNIQKDGVKAADV